MLANTRNTKARTNGKLQGRNQCLQLGSGTRQQERRKGAKRACELGEPKAQEDPCRRRSMKEVKRAEKQAATPAQVKKGKEERSG